MDSHRHPLFRQALLFTLTVELILLHIVLQKPGIYDGRNPHSVVILDNCSIRYCQEAIQMIQAIGALVHFLPPYSPDYNPIEEAFSKLKSSMKAMGEAQFMDMDTVILSAFATITPTDCEGWIRDSDYNFIINELLLSLYSVIINDQN